MPTKIKKTNQTQKLMTGKDNLKATRKIRLQSRQDINVRGIGAWSSAYSRAAEHKPLKIRPIPKNRCSDNALNDEHRAPQFETDSQLVTWLAQEPDEGPFSEWWVAVQQER